MDYNQRLQKLIKRLISFFFSWRTLETALMAKFKISSNQQLIQPLTNQTFD
jgi:hypothetical protein